MIARRDFLGLALASACVPRAAAGTVPTARVVVVGGGFAGATAAKYLRLLEPGLEVSLVTREREYVACPMSNEVLIGERDLKQQIWDHTALTRYGVKLVYADVEAVDPVRRRVTLHGGRRHEYDKLVLAPGIDFVWNAVEGYNEDGVALMPHAYKAGVQTLLLKSQIEAMRDGELALIAVPPAPIRCPPAPYERAALVAHYFKRHKPRSKVIVLDSNDSFPMQKWFEQEWERHYGSMVSWVSNVSGGKVERVDMLGRTLHTEFDSYQGDVVNFIPRQRAGAIAERAGVADASGFCPVNPVTLASTLQPDVHVIGDAAFIRNMAKSAHGAVSHAKVAAGAIAALVNGQVPPTIVEPWAVMPAPAMFCSPPTARFGTTS
jgi:sulfide dehydrogenase [flavocytochrome c] flavoprotein subunit